MKSSSEIGRFGAWKAVNSDGGRLHFVRQNQVKSEAPAKLLERAVEPPGNWLREQLNLFGAVAKRSNFIESTLYDAWL